MKKPTITLDRNGIDGIQMKARQFDHIIRVYDRDALEKEKIFAVNKKGHCLKLKDGQRDIFNKVNPRLEGTLYVIPELLKTDFKIGRENGHSALIELYKVNCLGMIKMLFSANGYDAVPAAKIALMYTTI